MPFDILEPVLERCTPEQLYRIEQSNQVTCQTSVKLLILKLNLRKERGIEKCSHKNS